MADVELRLIAQTDEYTAGIRQAQQANQSLYSQAAEGAKREKRYIEDIRRSMDQLRQARRMAAPGKEQDVYNKKLREAGVHLREAQGNLKKYNEELKKGEQITQKSTKSTNVLGGAMGKLMVAVGGLYGAWRTFKGIMESTDKTGDQLRITLGGVKGATDSLLRTIATGDFSNLLKNMEAGIKAARDYEKEMINLEHKQRSTNLELIKLQTQMREHLITMRDREGDVTVEQRKKALEEYQILNEESLKLQEALVDEERRILLKSLKEKKNISDQDLNNLVRYAEEYHKLTEGSLKELEALRAAEEALAEEASKQFAQPAATGAGRESQYDGRTRKEREDDFNHFKETQEKALVVHRERVNVIKSGLSEEAVAYHELEKQIDMFTAAERDAIVKNSEQKERALQEKLNAERMAMRYSEQIAREEKQRLKEIDEKAKADLEKFLAEIAKMEDTAEQQRIQRLTGLERIEAEKQYQLKQIQALEDHLGTLGKLEQEHYALLGALRGTVYHNANEAENDFLANQMAAQQKGFDEQEQKEVEHATAMSQLRREIRLRELELLDETGAAKLAFLIQEKEKELKILEGNSDEASRLKKKILQLDIDELQKEMDAITEVAEIGWRDYVDAFQTAYHEITSVLSSIFNEKVAHWQRERGLLDTRIAETQRAIDQEIKINEQGYASNIALKKKEYEDLKAEREKALAEEEAAIKKQRALDTLLQTTNLITASTNIFNSLSKFGAVGVGLAIATIATMFGAFAKVKIDAAKATKLAKGGSGTKKGMITGKSHAEGGENFLDHVEVERNEHFGVLAANRSKYAETFHTMVDLMNKDKFHLSKFIPKTQAIIVNNDFQSMESEIKGLRKDIKNQPQIFFYDKYRIEKIGNVTKKIWMS